MTVTPRARLGPRGLYLACIAALIAGLLGVGSLIAAEVGADDFRISNMGTIDGPLPADEADFASALAYNSATNQYLVVWAGDDTSPAGNNDFEIFGQLINAATGAEVGSDFLISNVGNGNATRDGLTPAVAYNATSNQYMVVWSGDETNNQFEIYGRLVSAVGAPAGASALRLSDMGPDNDDNFDAHTPSVACNSASADCMVVWSGNEITETVSLDVDPAFEIYGQLVSTTGGTLTATGTNDFRISDMGTNDDNALFDAVAPSVTSNISGTEYLVVWSGDDDTGGLVEDEFEIYGQRLSAAGAPLGTNDFRISDLGGNGAAGFDANEPAVTADGASGEYLVVWSGDDTAPGSGEDEIWGQRLQANGSEIGTNDFRLSDMGNDGNNVLNAVTPAVTHNSTSNEYLVVWSGDDVTNGEFEIYGQLLSATGTQTGTNDFQISDMGPTGDITYTATLPAVAYSTTSGEYLTVWTGDDNAGGLVNNQIEVFGQRLSFGPPPVTQADLRLSKVESRDPIPLGSGNLTYTLTVTNTGPAASVGVVLTDTLPTGVTVASVGTGVGVTCTQPAGLVRCVLGNLAVNATSVVTIAVTPSAAGTLTNTATVASPTTPDPIPANNSATITTTVSPPSAQQANLSVTAGAPGQADLGSLQTYTFTVTNSGPNTATAAQLNSTLPAGLELVSASSSVGSCTTNTGTRQVNCSLGNLANGASATVRITARATQMGAKNLVVTVSSATSDPVSSNNSATQSVTVGQAKIFLPIIFR
jgi:uncharacterized repeat protein (TIGR01451 family)